jgi:protein gp37
MGDKSKIEWTEATWTPIRARATTLQRDGTWKERIGWHCTHASPGCVNCYAEGINVRLGTGLKFLPANLYDPARHSVAEGKAELFLDERTLLAPLRWKRGRMIFVCSMTDLFADFVPDDWIDKVFAVMALCPQHTFQVLTKRSKRMRNYLEGLTMNRLRDAVQPGGWPVTRHESDAWLDPCASPEHRALYRAKFTTLPLPNVWIGVSAENQRRFDERWADLRETPAAVTFVSMEPLLGPIFFRPAKPDWVIVGGESGAAARPMHPDWARSLRDQCAAAGVPFFFKQWGEFAPAFDLALRPLRHYPWRGEDQTAVANGTATAEQATKRVGKRAAGRLLDGREHIDMPVWAAAPQPELLP